MSKNIFLKIITLILILSTFTLPFFEVAKVYAQQSGGYTTGGSYEFASNNSGITGGIGGYISVITPAIQELPLCQEKITNSKIKGLFKNTDFVLNKGEISDIETRLKAQKELNDSAAILVNDVNQRNTLEEIKKTSESTEKKISSLEENDTCLKSIGRMVVKLLLQKITFSTVEWINRGFEGKPLFLENPQSFFRDIATNELLQFRAEIGDPTLYPFARNFLRGQVNAINNRFAQNARYSANELISRTTPEYSAFTFSTDFKLGGWNAWNVLTQVPANNPIGFNVIATNELSFRLEGTSQSNAQIKQKDLDQSGGFLGVERCVANPEITKAEHRAALEKGERTKIPIVTGETADSPGTVTWVDDPNGEIIGICPGNKWEYVTPGKAVSESLTKVLNYPDNNLLRADDLNAAIATILDAALNRFIPQLLNEGFTSVSTEGRDGSFVYDNNGRTTGAFGQVYIDFPASSIRSSWLRENSDFNIRTDLTQAVIDEQRIYQEKLKEQNIILQDLTATVHQLDYCIPGPNPDFEETSRRVLGAVKNTIPSKTAEDFKEIGDEEMKSLLKAGSTLAGVAIASALTTGATLGSLAGPIGTVAGAAIGAVVFAIVSVFGGDDEYDKLFRYYSSIGVGLTGGVKLSKDSKITGKQDLTFALDSMLERYIQLIRHYYTPEFLPTITPSATREFRKIPGYIKKTEDNSYAINVLDGIIVRLAKMKDELDQMNPNVNTYNDYLPFITEFARLSGSMITGNDIAKTIDESKEYSAHIKYVYEDLLTGKFGCERDLMEQRQKPTFADATTDKRFKLRQTYRAEYPYRILYDYNALGPGEVIPVPPELIKYGIKSPNPRNTMPSYEIGPLGPGFLSSVAMDFTSAKVDLSSFSVFNPSSIINNNSNEKYISKFCPPEPRYEPYILDCLTISDLFIKVDDWPVSVGRNQGNALSGEGSDVNKQKDMSFEQTIGVY